jgi:hypothetical protein
MAPARQPLTKWQRNADAAWDIRDYHAFDFGRLLFNRWDELGPSKLGDDGVFPLIRELIDASGLLDEHGDAKKQLAKRLSFMLAQVKDHFYDGYLAHSTNVYMGKEGKDTAFSSGYNATTATMWRVLLLDTLLDALRSGDDWEAWPLSDVSGCSAPDNIINSTPTGHGAKFFDHISAFFANPDASVAKIKEGMDTSTWEASLSRVEAEKDLEERIVQMEREFQTRRTGQDVCSKLCRLALGIMNCFKVTIQLLDVSS